MDPICKAGGEGIAGCEDELSGCIYDVKTYVQMRNAIMTYPPCEL